MSKPAAGWISTGGGQGATCCPDDSYKYAYCTGCGHKRLVNEFCEIARSQTLAEVVRVIKEVEKKRIDGWDGDLSDVIEAVKRLEKEEK